MALAIDLLFSALGLIPTTHPSRSSVFGAVAVNYKLWLNLLATVIFVSLFAFRRGAYAGVKCSVHGGARDAASKG